MDYETMLIKINRAIEVVDALVEAHKKLLQENVLLESRCKNLQERYELARNALSRISATGDYQLVKTADTVGVYFVPSDSANIAKETLISLEEKKG